MAERRLPPLRLVSVFEAIVRTGGLQKAAADLNVTQPAVSHALRLLEDELGARLFDRRNRPATLTEAGRLLHVGVLESFRRLEQAVAEARAAAQASERSVTIACSVGTATYWLMPRLADFHAEHPDIAVNVMTLSGGSAPPPGVDLAIRYGLGEGMDGRSLRLVGESVTPVCSPAIRDAVLADGGLPQATLLHVRNEEASWLTFAQYFERVGLPENRKLGRYFSNYVQATQAALAGQGVMLGWQSNAGDLIREGRLTPLGAPSLVPAEAFYLVAPRAAKGTAASRIVEDWLVAKTGT